MPFELIHTSAAHGIDPNARGFTTVAMTQGISGPWRSRLESLSSWSLEAGIRGQLVIHRHVVLTVGGAKRHVLSRIAPCGLDYTGRPNRIAHHLLLDAGEVPPAGPAWVLGHGPFAQQWNDAPAIRGTPPAIPSGMVPPGPCTLWQQVTGDAGHAGLVLDHMLGASRKTLTLVLPEGAPALEMMAQAIALLPPAQRWQATFTTLAQQLPAEATCALQVAIAGTQTAKTALAHPGMVALDASNMPPAGESAHVHAARSGQAIAATSSGQDGSAAMVDPRAIRAQQAAAAAQAQAAGQAPPQPTPAAHAPTGSMQPMPVQRPEGVAAGGPIGLEAPHGGLSHQPGSWHPSNVQVNARSKSNPLPWIIASVCGALVLVLLVVLMMGQGSGAGSETSDTPPQQANGDQAQGESPHTPGPTGGGAGDGADDNDPVKTSEPEWACIVDGECHMQTVRDCKIIEGFPLKDSICSSLDIKTLHLKQEPYRKVTRLTTVEDYRSSGTSLQWYKKLSGWEFFPDPAQRPALQPNASGSFDGLEYLLVRKRTDSSPHIVTGIGHWIGADHSPADAGTSEPQQPQHIGCCCNFIRADSDGAIVPMASEEDCLSAYPDAVFVRDVTCQQKPQSVELAQTAPNRDANWTITVERPQHTPQQEALSYRWFTGQTPVNDNSSDQHRLSPPPGTQQDVAVLVLNSSKEIIAQGKTSITGIAQLSVAIRDPQPDQGPQRPIRSWQGQEIKEHYEEVDLTNPAKADELHFMVKPIGDASVSLGLQPWAPSVSEDRTWTTTIATPDGDVHLTLIEWGLKGEKGETLFSIKPHWGKVDDLLIFVSLNKAKLNRATWTTMLSPSLQKSDERRAGFISAHIVHTERQSGLDVSWSGDDHFRLPNLSAFDEALKGLSLTDQTGAGPPVWPDATAARHSRDRWKLERVVGDSPGGDLGTEVWTLAPNRVPQGNRPPDYLKLSPPDDWSPPGSSQGGQQTWTVGFHDSDGRLSTVYEVDLNPKAEHAPKAHPGLGGQDQDDAISNGSSTPASKADKDTGEDETDSDQENGFKLEDKDEIRP
ncbi:MAG: hypothetical protein MK101_09720 [Phycisphaerales bacterium]|nr:hypothetical protein [Phycisphaerales bacterium]